MINPAVIPAPRAAPDHLEPPHYWVVPCTDAQHELLLPVVLALHVLSKGQLCEFPAICGRTVRPASAAHPAESDTYCPHCPRQRQAMSPQPTYTGSWVPLMHALARRLSPRRPPGE